MTWIWLIALAVAQLSSACKREPDWERGKKYLHYALRERVATMDPVRATSNITSLAQSQVYEPLYTYKYLTRPLAIEPLLAADMPVVSDDLTVYTITLKPGVRFQDDPCFVDTGGAGRTVVASDVVYSYMRMADRAQSPRGWWLFRDRIVGFDEFKQRMDERAADEPFDWNATISGLRAIDDRTVRIQLKRPFPQFRYIMTMSYTAIVPRECAAYYGKEFGSHPVGTGPFRLREWTRGVQLIYNRNPSYHHAVYPSEASEEARKRGLLARAGERIPFLDGLVLHVFDQDQPMWLEFRVGDLDLVQVPPDYQPALFTSDWQLREQFSREGVGYYKLALLDFIYHGFNMDDEVFGRGQRAKYLRQAISLAVDTGEINATFYNSANVLYDGPIPPDLDGYRPGVTSRYRGPDIERARELLRKAGHPDGEGLPPIVYDTDHLTVSVEQTEMYARQLQRIGIELDAGHHSFPVLTDKLKSRKSQLFRLAWLADYPDAENFLQLFYGPNETPGSNNFNYKNPAYDRLYEQARTLPPGDRRTALYRQMRQIVIEDVPAFGSMARTRFYAWNKRVRNAYPSETFHCWLKYLDVVPR